MPAAAPRDGRAGRKKNGVNSLTIEDAQYLAALVDGEGCIAIVPITTYKTKTPNFSLRLFIAQANRQYLVNIQEMIGAGQIHRTRPGNYQLQISGKEAAAVIAQIHDFLKLKQDQAGIALEYQDTQTKSGGDYFRVGQGGGRLPKSILDRRARLAAELKRLHIPVDRREPPPEMQDISSPELQNRLPGF